MTDFLITFAIVTIAWICILWKIHRLKNEVRETQVEKAPKTESHTGYLMGAFGFCLFCFVLGNFHFLFTYLPHRSEYRQATATIYWEHWDRRAGTLVDIQFEVDGTLQYSRNLPCAFNEHACDKIPIAYREHNGKILDVSRSRTIIDDETLFFLINLFWVCVLCLVSPEKNGS